MVAKKNSVELISQAEAARILGVTRSAVSYLVDDEKLRAESVGGRRFVYRASVEDYKKIRSVKKTSKKKNPDK
jgi:excisionase family DNA binding protein